MDESKYDELKKAGFGVCNFVVGCHSGSDHMCGSYNIVLGDHIGGNLRDECHRLLIGTIVDKELTHEQWQKLHEALEFALKEEMPMKINFSDHGNG
jgi:hypothetical protein